jgi:hypothetical protein
MNNCWHSHVLQGHTSSVRVDMVEKLQGGREGWQQGMKDRSRCRAGTQARQQAVSMLMLMFLPCCSLHTHAVRSLLQHLVYCCHLYACDGCLVQTQHLTHAARHSPSGSRGRSAGAQMPAAESRTERHAQWAGPALLQWLQMPLTPAR